MTTTSGTVRGKALVATQGFEIDWNRSSSGETNFINFRDQGVGGFNFQSGGSVLASIDSSGTVVASGVSATNATFTTVNARRPAYLAPAFCTSSNCTATGAPGVVKRAFGFHGSNGTNSNVNGDFVCGSGFVWLGSCIGQPSCTLTTGCGTSSVVAECW